MKIAIIARIYSKKGGISRYAAELAEGLSKEHEVHVFANSWQDASDKIIFHKVPMIKGNFFLKRKKAGLATILQVYSFALMLNWSKIDTNSFDVVHTQGDSFCPFDIFTAHSCHKVAVKVARQSTSGLYNFLKNTRINPLNLIVLWIEKFTLKKGRYKKIISVSEGVKREIIENYNLPAEDIVAIPNGVALEEFNPKNKNIWREEIRNKYNIKNDDILLLFTGYEFKRKGLKYIIEALPLIDNKEVKILVVGRDDEKPFYNIAKQLGVEKRVVFVGYSTEVNRYYAASDIFVFPTLYEAFSLATIEAVASGLPILTTKVNGTEELVQDGYNGFFIKRDAKDIAEKVNLLIKNPLLITQLGENARKTAEKYSWQKIVKRTLEVYKEVKLRKESYTSQN
ncbi:MAG: glycosyltransferase family 4 protein [bacterium]